jgi:hypothetical protein
VEEIYKHFAILCVTSLIRDSSSQRVSCESFCLSAIPELGLKKTDISFEVCNNYVFLSVKINYLINTRRNEYTETLILGIRPVRISV